MDAHACVCMCVRMCVGDLRRLRTLHMAFQRIFEWHPCVLFVFLVALSHHRRRIAAARQRLIIY